MVKELCIDSDWSCFQGHFPENPVMPAVAVFDRTLEFIRKENGDENLHLSKVRNAKFMHAIKPNMKVRIEFKKVEENRWKIQWTASPSEARALPTSVALTP